MKVRDFCEGHYTPSHNNSPANAGDILQRLVDAAVVGTRMHRGKVSRVSEIQVKDLPQELLLLCQSLHKPSDAPLSSDNLRAHLLLLLMPEALEVLLAHGVNPYFLMEILCWLPKEPAVFPLGVNEVWMAIYSVLFQYGTEFAKLGVSHRQLTPEEFAEHLLCGLIVFKRTMDGQRIAKDELLINPIFQYAQEMADIVNPQPPRIIRWLRWLFGKQY